MQEKIINDIYYKEFNPKNFKDVIVILHGWGGSSDSWLEVGKLLEKASYRVIIPDLPGFGKTKLKNIFTLDDYANTVIDFVRDLKIKNVILWGHSNGGAISIKIVNKIKNCNKEEKINFKIEKLILNNSAGIRNDKKRSLKRKIFSVLIKPFRFLASFEMFKGLRKLFYRAIGSQDYIQAETKSFLKETYLNMISSDLKKEIKEIKVPTLLIWGENDTYTPLSDGKFMSENIKNSKLIISENQKHGIHLKNPEKLVKTFLENY